VATNAVPQNGQWSAATPAASVDCAPQDEQEIVSLSTVGSAARPPARAVSRSRSSTRLSRLGIARCNPQLGH
jgi:hypothetical protein